MGKPKLKKKKKARNKTKTDTLTGSSEEQLKTANLKTSEDFGIDKLLDKAEENFDTFNYEVAQKFCQRAMELDPNNLRGLELTGSLLMEMQDFEGAKQCLDQAVSIAPEIGFEKFMTLGQLHNGTEALEYYHKGIRLLSEEIKKTESQSMTEEASNAVDVQKNLVRTLSTAYCSIAELYLTDCCDEENAERECKNSLEKAIEVDSTNAEAFQTLARFYLILNDKDKAQEFIQKGLSLWLPKYQAIREGKLETLDVVEVCTLNYPVRISAVKILIELEQFEDSALILEGLVEEDDEVVEVWYLLGWMNYLKGEDYKTNAKFYFKKCLEVAKNVASDEEEILNHVNELLEGLGSVDSDEDKENDDNDDNYEDVMSSEDES